MNYENLILRPALIRVLSAVPELVVHVAPVEALTAAQGRRRPVTELGAGTPDLLCSLRWRYWDMDEGHRTEVFGAAWLALELKRPALPEGPSCTRCCAPCETKSGGWRARYRLSACCGVPIFDVPAGGQKAGQRSPDQIDVHAAWQRAGRWCFTVRTPAGGLAVIDEARARLRVARLEPVAVAPAPALPEIRPVLPTPRRRRP